MANHKNGVCGFPGYQLVDLLPRPAGRGSALGADPQTTGRRKSPNLRVETIGSAGRTNLVSTSAPPAPPALVSCVRAGVQLLRRDYDEAPSQFASPSTSIGIVTLAVSGDDVGGADLCGAGFVALFGVLAHRWTGETDLVVGIRSTVGQAGPGVAAATDDAAADDAAAGGADDALLLLGGALAANLQFSVLAAQAAGLLTDGVATTVGQLGTDVDVSAVPRLVLGGGGGGVLATASLGLMDAAAADAEVASTHRLLVRSAVAAQCAASVSAPAACAVPFTLLLHRVCGGRSSAQLRLSALYDAARHAPSSVAALLAAFVQLLRAVSSEAAAAVPASELPLLSAAETHALLHPERGGGDDGGVAAAAADAAATGSGKLHHIFERTAAATPHAPAVLTPVGVGAMFMHDWNPTAAVDVALSYGKLDAQATAMAIAITARIGAGAGRSGGSVQPGTFVAILLPRSAQFYVALLATLKAGGAYVSIDAEYPADRTRHILEDSGAALLITTNALVAHLELDQNELQSPAELRCVGGLPRCALLALEEPVLLAALSLLSPRPHSPCPLPPPSQPLRS